MRILMVALLFVVTRCAADAPTTQPDGERYKWAFAQDMNGSFKQNEYCREFLADSLYADANKDRTFREAATNVFVFRGSYESYRVYAFKTQQECETALTNMVQRRALGTASAK
jgi:hypothetical protein